jgi:hypothetical protein
VPPFSLRKNCCVLANWGFANIFATLISLDLATGALAGDWPSEANHLASAGCQSKAMVLRNCYVRWPRLEKVVAVWRQLQQLVLKLLSLSIR